MNSDSAFKDSATIVTRFWTEYWNAGDERLAAELLAEDLTWRDPALPEIPQGRVNYVEGVYDRIRTAFPDVEVHVREQLTSGTDRVVCAWTATGTHHGPLDDLPPTGRPVCIDGLSLFRVTDGRITDHTAVWDAAGLHRQIGAKA